MMEKMKMHSPNLTEENIARIRELFPGCVTEAQGDDGKLRLAVDFDQLRQELSESIVEGPQERYHLNWPGKREALLTANAPIARTLRPCREESVDFDTTKNLFIEGDNLEALKLLQENYLSAIDLIYIDPPYNTGQDFIYRDNFQVTAEEYHIATNQVDEVGNRFVANLESNGRFHSDWLSMMYARLKVARRLLSEQGAIFISIDDEEQENLKKICDEIFGEENYVNTISVNMKNVAGASGGGEDKRLKKNIEYLHVYVRSRVEFVGFNNAYDLFPIIDMVQEYRDEGKSWKYTSVLVDPGKKIDIGATVDGDGNDIRIFERRGYVIKSIGQIQKEEGISEEEVYNKYAKNIFQTAMPQSSIRPRVMTYVQENGGVKSDLYSIEYTPRSGRNKGQLYEQFYKGENFRLFAWLRDVAEERNGTLYKKEMRGTYWDYASETKNLTKEGGIPFQNGKKPLAMLRRIVEMQPANDFTVLDFFAGSGSMAHAVLASNAEDGGSRRFVVVQLPEQGEAEEAGFANVAELSKERIRRAGRKILEGESHEGWNKDIGFRVLKVDSSNMADVYYTPDAIEQGQLKIFTDNIKSDRKPEDLLFQVLLDWGVDLSLPIRKETIQSKTVFFVNEPPYDLIACFDTGVNEDLVKELARFEPLRVVFRDSGFVSDAVKINVEQIFKQMSPYTEVRSI
jgi:adenine-specific DNA-methyltransferase